MVKGGMGNEAPPTHKKESVKWIYFLKTISPHINLGGRR